MTLDQDLTQFMQKLQDPWFVAGFIALAIRTLVWKGLALWRAAKNNSLPWFVALLVLNTSGILEIIYIFFFSKKKEQQV